MRIRMSEKFRFAGYIRLKDALKDYLREQGLTLDDILDAMDETPELIEASFLKRVNITPEDFKKLEATYTSRQLNLLIFVIQVFYFANVSGLYKNRLIVPLREEVVGPDGRITKEGLVKIIRSLGLRPKWAIGGGAFF